MTAWLRELARLTVAAQLAIPYDKAGRELNPDRPRDATETVARVPYLEKRDARSNPRDAA